MKAYIKKKQTLHHLFLKYLQHGLGIMGENYEENKTSKQKISPNTQRTVQTQRW